MATNRRVQVVTNQRGTIVAVLRLAPEGALSKAEGSDKNDVQVRLTPMAGQFVTDVLLPEEIGLLETAEDFQRLVAEFDLPPKSTELRRKRGSLTE